MFKTKKRLNEVLKRAVELYDADQFSKNKQNLTRKQIRSIKNEIKDIAAKKITSSLN
jgi:hypothetical protein